jgi:hypothetical protein
MQRIKPIVEGEEKLQPAVSAGNNVTGGNYFSGGDVESKQECKKNERLEEVPL